MRSRYTWLGLAMLLVAAPAQAQVLITEVQPNPAGSGTDSGEWVEIHNTGTGVVSIEGWILNDFGPTRTTPRSCERWTSTRARRWTAP